MSIFVSLKQVYGGLIEQQMQNNYTLWEVRTSGIRTRFASLHVTESGRILYGSENAQIQEREDSLDFFLLFSFNVSFVYLRSIRELALMNPYIII